MSIVLSADSYMHTGAYKRMPIPDSFTHMNSKPIMKLQTVSILHSVWTLMTKIYSYLLQSFINDQALVLIYCFSCWNL